MEAGFSGGNADGAWRVVEGPLLFVWVKNTQWDAEDVKPAPRARLAGSVSPETHVVCKLFQFLLSRILNL